MKQTRPIGIMQGRLLPKYKGRYQAHPLGYWMDEFPIAAGLGLYCIEWILDHNDWQQNPLMSDKGIQSVLSVTEQTGVKVLSVCADYFMEAPLHDKDPEVVKQSIAVLTQLIKASHQINAKDIVIPCVDQSSLRSEEDKAAFVAVLTPLCEDAERYCVNISLETDLAPASFADLLGRFDSSRITVNYDTGNSASLGYDPLEEFSAYGNRISDIHIKDRKLNSGSVVLGTGDTRFDHFFAAFEKIKFDGPFIMQAFRDDEGVHVFRQQLDWFRENFLNS